MPDYNKPPSTYIDPREHKAQDVQDFLRKIGLLESSDGTNLNHPEVTSGLNAGTSAVGTYGLMPLTAQDIDRQSGNNQLQDMDTDEVSSKLQEDPDLNQRLSETLASKLLSKNPSETAAFKWEHGQNSKPSPDQLENSDRVRKFRVLNNGQ